MLTLTDWQALDRDGYLLVPNALTGADVLQLRAAFEDAPVQSSGTQHVELEAHTPNLAAWHALETHAVLIAAARHVLGDSFHLRNLHGRNPLPGFGQQGLHADTIARKRGEPFAALTALWLLDPFTHENGATRVVPGSHHGLQPIPKALAQPSAHHPDELVITGECGSVLILNGHLWHSGRRNDGSSPRRIAQLLLARGPA